MSEPLLPVPPPEENSYWDPMPARCPECGGIIDDRVRGDGKAWCQFHGLVTPSFRTREVREECEFEQRNPHEWYCTIHGVLKIAGTQEPVSCQ